MDFLIRKATMDDINELRELYLSLEEDAVPYQPEHFVIGERTERILPYPMTHIIPGSYTPGRDVDPRNVRRCFWSRRRFVR